MPMVIPVDVRNNMEATRWFAYSIINRNISGMGSDREEALRKLERKLRSLYGTNDIELSISSETVNFPTGVSMREYLESRQRERDASGLR